MRRYLLFDIFVFCQAANFSYRQDDMLSCFLPCLLPLFHHKIWFHIFRAPSYFLKVKYSFFQKQQQNKFIFKCLISLGRFQALCKIQALPPSPKKAIRFGPSKICLVLLHSSPQASCSARRLVKKCLLRLCYNTAIWRSVTEQQRQ